MVYVNVKSLLDKLNEPCHRSLGAAAEFCSVQTHYHVEIEHWLLKLSEMPNTDLCVILEDQGFDLSFWRTSLAKWLERFKKGNFRPPVLSTHVVDWIRAAWLLCSVDYGCRVIRSGHLLLALLSDESLSAAAPDVFNALAKKISPIALREELPLLIAQTCESEEGIENTGKGDRE
jgi:type VI secretion system protein VasG